MTAAAGPVCVVTVAGLTAAVSEVPVYADDTSAGPWLRRPGRPRSRPLPGPVHRVRVEVRRGGTGSPGVDEHLRAGLHAPAPWPRAADVLLAPGSGPADMHAAAAHHPGALVVAVHRGGRCWLRYDGRVRCLRVDDPGAGWRWRAVASAVHGWLTAGLLTDPLPGPVRLRTTPRARDGTLR